MKLHLLLAASCIAASLPAHALQPVELSDPELAQLRGRFVMPGRIVHFGVTMESIWQNSKGQVLGGQVNMQINQGMFKPQFTVTTVARDGGQDAPLAGTGQVQGGAGLGQVSGVSQSVRSAGDFNSAYNDVSIKVSKGNAAPNLGQGSQTLAAASSSKAGSVSIAPNSGGLRIVIDALGQGTSLQQLGAGGLQQHTTIMGSGNAVNSLASLDLILRDSGMSMEQVKACWDQLGNLRPAGY